MKKKGTRLERELFHKFWENGFCCVRIAGSGSTTLPAPDLLVGKEGRILAIECKSGKSRRYLKRKQIEELRIFSKKFGAEPWIGVRFDNEKWLFLRLNKLGKSKKGTPFIDINLSKKYGIGFEELIGEFKQTGL